MYVVKCDAPECGKDVEVEEIEIPDGWLVLVECQPAAPGADKSEQLELGVFCSSACVAAWALEAA